MSLQRLGLGFKVTFVNWKKMSEISKMKFKDKCKVLHLERISHVQVQNGNKWNKWLG